MLIVRETFMAKPGHASKLAKLFTEFPGGMGKNMRIMTDLTGVYNKVVIESEYATLAEFEKDWMDYMKDHAAEMEKFREQYQPMYTQGKREIFRVVA